MTLSQGLPESFAQIRSANPIEPRGAGRYRPLMRKKLANDDERERGCVFRHVAQIAILLMVLGFGQHSVAQINVDTTTPGVTNGQCSLQEALYAAEFGTNKAISQIFNGKDVTYPTGCADPSGNWNTVVLQNLTYQFNVLWDGDAHNPFGPTATPIVFKSVTIQGNGAELQWTGAGYSRLFAVGFANLNNIDDGTAYSGTGNLTLEDVYVVGFKVHGGNGACGGGGGMGAGGAIYVGKVSSGIPTLTVINSTFDSNSAFGGDGTQRSDCQTTIEGTRAGGGGGGLSGNGGPGGQGSTSFGPGGGGGGARGNGGAGCDSCNGGGGGGGTVFSGGVADSGGPGGEFCGGSGGGADSDGHDAICAGGGGGGGGDNETFGSAHDGGNGAYGGGGGGGASGNGTDGGGSGHHGGFAGGGAGSGDCGTLTGCPDGGNGGFGAGGGAGVGSQGNGGAFAGNATSSRGGGGAALGGAIFSDSGNVTIQNSTLNRNSVTPGSGANNGADGGAAIFTRNGSLTVQNVTISGNHSNSNGGGISVINDGSSASLTLNNTILANNGGDFECETVNFVGTKGSGNLILSNRNSGCPGVAVKSDPQLSTLQPNSPGDTPTMAIQAGISPAVDAADDSVVSANAVLQTAQNGLSRPQAAHSDIGAYEAPPPSADLSITKAVSSAAAQPGDTVTYTVSVTNAGPNDATSVTVADILPTQLTFASCTESTGNGSCTFTNGTVTVTYATLANGASSTVTIQGTLNSGVTDGLNVGNTASVSASSPTELNTANNSSTAYFTIHNKADLAVTKSVSSTSAYWPQGIEVGDSLTYTITLTNKGPYDAKSVVLSDSAPTGVTFTGCTASVGSCVWSPTSASLSLSSFTNASVATLTIQATVNFGVADGSTITNTASVTSPTNDPDPTNNAGSASFTVLNKADLFLTQTAGKLTNQQLTYSVSVKNLGPYQAKQLLLNDPMPAGTKFVSVAAGPWTCTPLPVNSTGTLSCTVATLNLNATDSLSFTVKVTTTGKNISNTATVSAATFDPNLANNTATLVTKSGAGK